MRYRPFFSLILDMRLRIASLVVGVSNPRRAFDTLPKEMRHLRVINDVYVVAIGVCAPGVGGSGRGHSERRVMELEKKALDSIKGAFTRIHDVSDDANISDEAVFIAKTILDCTLAVCYQIAKSSRDIEYGLPDK
jgi:hypothetical protein